MRDIQVKTILFTLIFIHKLDCSEIFDKGYTYGDNNNKDVIYEEEFNEPDGVSSISNEISPKLLESNTNVGEIADNYFILFKKPSSEDDDEDVVIDDDDVVASDSDDITLDDGRSRSSGISGEPQFQSTSTTTEESLSTATTTTSSTTSVEGHFDSVNAFAETTENNTLRTRKERDEEDDSGDGEKEFSSRKGYYHFTGNRLPSSALSSSTSTSTSSNYTKVGVTNQDDMVDSAFERHKAYRRNNKKYGHKSHKKKHKDYWKYGQKDEQKTILQYPYYLGRQMSYYYPSTKGRHSIDIIKSNGHQKQSHHQHQHHHLNIPHFHNRQHQNHLQHHHLQQHPNPHQYNQHTHPIYQYKRWSYDKGVEEFIPPYVRKYNRRNKQLFNLLKGTTTTTTTSSSMPALFLAKRRRNHKRKHHYHSHKNPKWLIEDLFEEQKANPNNPNANNENQYNYVNKRRTTTKSAVTATTNGLQTTTTEATTASATTTTSTAEPPVDDDFKLLVQNNFPGDVSVEMDVGDEIDDDIVVDSEKEEIEKSYGNQNSLINSNHLPPPPSIRRSHLGKTFEILYEKSKELKNQTASTAHPPHQFFYHRIDAPRTVGVGETGRKQRLPFVAITDRRLEPSKLLSSGAPATGAVAVSKRENNILPMP
ncbi:hypothetical protein ACFFRR_002986 [Megaselia abdita]